MTVAKKSSRSRASVTRAEPPPARPASKPPVNGARKPAAEAASAAVASAARPKPKLVRDSFTIPKSEYSVLEGLKARATNLTRPAKKSELLRAGIAALNAMNDQAFLAALNGVPSLKTGRPKGSAASSA
jgi:hypothetical protein